MTQSIYGSVPHDLNPAATVAATLQQCDSILGKLTDDDVAALLTAGGIVSRSEPGHNRLILRKKILGS
jgi:hypothetical protein